VAFDGSSIWVTNEGDNTVSQLMASTGALVGTYSVGSGPVGMTFDGANIWVCNQNSDSVSKL
jgi:YVTN family beta-propeller protein